MINAKAKSALLFSVLMVMGITAAVNAQPHAGGPGMFYLYAGKSMATVNTTAFFNISEELAQTFPGINTTLDLEDDINFPSSPDLLYLRAFGGGRFSVVGSYWSLNREGSGLLTRQFAFGDSVYEVGATVDGFLNMDYYSLSLKLSVVHNPLVTAGFSLGGRYIQLDAGIDARSNGYQFVRNGSFNVPVIVPGIHGSVHALPRTLVRGSFEYFSIKLNDARGRVIDAQLSAEYYLLKYLGVGVGFSLFDISADDLPENELYLHDVNFSVKGFNIYAALRF